MGKTRSDRYSVVITSNPLNHEGGVVAFNSLLLKQFANSEWDVQHHTLGSRMDYFYRPITKRILYPLFYMHDLLGLIILLVRNRRIRIVQVNPSLIPVPLIRDGLVIVLTRLLGCKVIVIFHGWKEYLLTYLKKHTWSRWLFSLVYRQADITLVLASRFKDDLLALGWAPSSVQVTTTMFEAEAVLPSVNRSGKPPQFLFLGRISQLKGIGELIEAAKILTERNYDFEFLIVGHGDCEGVVEEYSRLIYEYGLESHLHFTGQLMGKEKYQVYAESDVYVFPSWTEGCPTSVLEALGAGLFVISTDVGALKDIISDGDNGKIVRCRDHLDLAEALVWACENIENIRNHRHVIQTDALACYESGIVTNQFRRIYEGFIFD